MKRILYPGRFSGTVTPPPSKSMAHRLILGAALAEGRSTIRNVEPSQDIAATIRCARTLGTTPDLVDGICTIRSIGSRRPAHCPLPYCDCGESGSTLRFFIPVTLAVTGGGIFSGRGRLMARPQTPYFELFQQHGISYDLKYGLLTICGHLHAGEYCLPGDISSQFFTGLFYALALLDGPSVVRSTTALESRSYLTMSLRVLASYGITWEEPEPGVFTCAGGLSYRPGDYTVETDWSAAAFWYAANSLGGQVEIGGLDPDSAQGDRVIAHWAKAMAAPGQLEIDVSDCPDLVPALGAMAALRAGETTRIVNAARLRIKESDRLTAVSNVLSAMGAEILELPDGLVIHGQAVLPGGTSVSSHNDHRIAMMAAIAASGCRAPVTLTGAEVVAKSYPGFWADYDRLLERGVRP